MGLLLGSQLTRITRHLQEHIALSADSTLDPEHMVNFPHEFLHTISPDGLPPHQLRLKVGMPIMMIRNLDQLAGQANGTIFVIKHIRTHVLQATIMNGNHKGDDVLISRIKLISNDESWPFQLTRRQFPVKPEFALTINKAQGQTLQYMGLYLPRPVFSHGQLYVALSQVGSKERITIMVLGGKALGVEGVHTKNVVYREVFTSA